MEKRLVKIAEVPAPDARRNVHDRLVALLTDEQQRSPVAMRALAGRTLNSLGDKRPGVDIIERGGVKLPDIAWGEEVPAGEYMYQNTKITIQQTELVHFSEQNHRVGEGCGLFRIALIRNSSGGYQS